MGTIDRMIAEKKEQETDAERIATNLAWLLARLFLGPAFSSYALWSLFHRDVPWYVDLAVGFVVYRTALVAALLCWVARHCGIDPPLWPALVDHAVRIAWAMKGSA